MEQTYDTSASSFSLGGLDPGATCSPMRFDWGEHEPGHRSCSEHFPIELWFQEEQVNGRFYRTASGEWIPDGEAWQFQGYDDNGLLRSLNGRLTWCTKCCAVLQRSRLEPRNEVNRDQQCKRC